MPEVLRTTDRLQAAFMSLAPGDDSGEVSAHEGNQLVYVTSGSGTVVMGRARVRLQEGDLFIIPARRTHVIRNTGRKAMTTLNVYAPPEYEPGYRD